MAQEPHNNDRQRLGAGSAAQTPQQDHTPRQEEQHAREQQQRASQPKARAAAPVDEKAEEREREARAAASIGAQVILDFNEDGSIGARGGAGGDIVANTMARDAHLVAMGLDPVTCSGPPPSVEVLKARRAAEEARLKEQTEGPQMPGKATRVSSLAAGIVSGEAPEPANEPPAEAG